jgi:hypothetical protein
LVADPHDPAGRRVLLLDNGGNVAPPAPSLAYVIEDRGGGATVEWSHEPVAITVEEALRPEAAPSHQGEQADERFECEDWLRTLLAERVMSTIDVFKAGHADGFSRDRIRRAKYRIGAVAKKEGFGGTGQWRWGLDVDASNP